jgi:hypothetical protein
LQGQYLVPTRAGECGHSDYREQCEAFEALHELPQLIGI